MGERGGKRKEKGILQNSEVLHISKYFWNGSTQFVLAQFPKGKRGRKEMGVRIKGDWEGEGKGKRQTIFVDRSIGQRIQGWNQSIHFSTKTCRVFW